MAVSCTIFSASSWLITEMHGQQNVKISTYVPGHNQHTLREHTVSTLDSGHHQAMTRECELKAISVVPWPDDAPSLGSKLIAAYKNCRRSIVLVVPGNADRPTGTFHIKFKRQK